ncbi:hypothetical protein [Patulibacter minatonensis]|uniref:hypothetical protein n=1 Tax=Patulibacter minatonensis TaxID=298163 RepID=UPI00047E8376|nr:hypothetical protein [Patulibacter minatonensis]
MALADEQVRAHRQTRSTGLRNGGYRATIRSNPASENDPLKLVIPALSPENRWTCTNWELRGPDLPMDGDTGLVIVDNTGDLWLMKWTPSA